MHYSELGSNARAKEEQTYIFFTDYLEECELGRCVYVCKYVYVYNYISVCMCICNI